MANSSYYYQKQSMQREDKYQSVRKLIKKYFIEYKQRYGYRRTHSLLKRDGIVISEKVIRRIMTEERLFVEVKWHKKYNCYQGEISPAVENIKKSGVLNVAINMLSNYKKERIWTSSY